MKKGVTRERPIDQEELIYISLLSLSLVCLFPPTWFFLLLLTPTLFLSVCHCVSVAVAVCGIKLFLRAWRLGF